MSNKNSTSYDQNILNQIPYDLLSYTLSNEENLAIDQEFANTFFSNLSEQNISSGVADMAPVPSPGIPNFYSSNFEGVSPLDTSALPLANLSTPFATPDYFTPSTHPLQEDLDEFLTPLVSPAITPNYTDIYEFLDPPNEQYFTPLSSPALPPEINNNRNETLSPTSTSKITLNNAALLSQQLAQIEAKQQLLRDQLIQSPSTSPRAYRKSPLALFSSRNQAPPSPLPFNNNKKRPSLRQKIAMSNPQLHSSQTHHINPPTTPATPASLMKNYQQQQQQQQQHVTHPLSPKSQAVDTSSSIASNDTVAKADNNYTTEMVDAMPTLPPAAFFTPVPTAVDTNVHPTLNKKRKLAPSSPVVMGSSPRTLKPLISPFLQPDTKTTIPSPNAFTPGIENRRSAHKVAEQRRRDTLKQSFDYLRREIADVLVTDTLTYDETKKSKEHIREEKEKEVKLMSKVLLLQHSYEYIVRLKNDGKHKDKKIELMQSELEELRKLCNSENNDN